MHAVHEQAQAVSPESSDGLNNKNSRVDCSPARQRDDPIDVLFVVGSVDHISKLLSTRCPQRVLLEHAEGNGLVGANDDFNVVRRPHRSLRVAEPWADAKPELESFAPNINAQLFLECEGQARRAM